MASLRIGVVGAGRVGSVLAAALRTAGHEIVAVSGRSPASLTRVETLLPGVALVDPVEVPRGVDLVLLAVPDDALADVVRTLLAADALGPGQLVAHVSGRHGTSVLADVRSVGARPLALHPAMTFTGTDVDLDRLASTCFALTAAPTEREVAEALVADLGGVAMWLDEAQRTLYHAALAHGANHLVTLVAQAQGLLRQAGADDPSAVLRPLLEAALGNALAYGDAALTGPVVRGDVSTVAAHVDALADSPSTTVDAYLEMARATTARAVAAGRLDADRARATRRVLDEADHEAFARLASGADRRTR